MAKYVVTRAFQFKGGMSAVGSIVTLTDEEAKSEFYASRTRPLEKGEDENAQRPAPNLGNGKERQREDAPAKELKGESDGMTAAELRASLEKLGVPCPPNLKKAELAALWEQAKNAAAGSPEGGNAPAEKGV